MRFFSKKVKYGAVFLCLCFALAVSPSLYSKELKEEITDALSKSDTTLAIELLEKEIKLDPSYEYNYFILGEIYYERQNYTAAEAQFLLTVKKDKKFWPGVYKLGLVHLKLDKIDEAEENFARGLKKAKKMKAQFHNGMGLVLLAREQYNDAYTEFLKAKYEDSTNAEIYLNLGDANFFMKIYSSAISAYEKALALDTASRDVYFRWAEACLKLKDYTCALEKLNIVLQKDSTYSIAWWKAGGIYYKASRSSRGEEANKHYKATIGSYNKYFELSNEKPDSTNGRAYYETAMSYLVLRGFADAKSNFSTVLSIPVEPKDIYFYYARACHGNKDYDSALVLYQKHADWVKEQGADYRSGISDREIYRRMGECHEKLKDRYNTIKYYTKSLEYDSTQARLLFGVAVAYNYVGDYRNALIYYMKRIALGIDERFWSLYYNAATSALYLVEKGGSAMVEEDDLGLDDDEPDEVVENDPLEGVDLTDLALEYLEKVTIEFWDYVSSNEKNQKTVIKALTMLGSTYLYQKADCQKGLENFNRVLELDGENCEALKSIGYGYFGGLCPSNYNKALSNLQKALACYAKKDTDKCKEVDLTLWVAQTYQFRALEKRDAKNKEGSKKDFKAAYDWYLKVLDCDAGNKAATEGRDQVKFEF